MLNSVATLLCLYRHELLPGYPVDPSRAWIATDRRWPVALARVGASTDRRPTRAREGVGLGLSAAAGAGARLARERGALGRARNSTHPRSLGSAGDGAPPTFYLPLVDAQRELLLPAGNGSFCERKGPARYWHLVDGDRCLALIAWSYPQPLTGAEPLADGVAFHAHHLNCSVGGARVTPQAGDFYGGWITP